LILLSLGYELAAVDALRAAEDPQEAILWRQDLIEPMPGIIRSSQPMRRRTIKNDLFGIRYIALDTAGRPIARIGPLNDTGVCYQRRREVACVEPLTGQAIWVRDNVEQGSDIFGDDELVFVVPPNSEEATVLNALDGRLMGRRKVGAHEHRWATLGRLILLTNDDEHEQLELRLHDPWAGTDVWRRQLAKGSKAQLIGHDEVAVMQPDGQFAIYSLLRVALSPAVRDGDSRAARRACETGS
jgi:hypothetical protein